MSLPICHTIPYMVYAEVLSACEAGGTPLAVVESIAKVLLHHRFGSDSWRAELVHVALPSLHAEFGGAAGAPGVDALSAPHRLLATLAGMQAAASPARQMLEAFAHLSSELPRAGFRGSNAHLAPRALRRIARDRGWLAQDRRRVQRQKRLRAWQNFQRGAQSATRPLTAVRASLVDFLSAPSSALIGVAYGERLRQAGFAALANALEGECAGTTKISDVLSVLVRYVRLCPQVDAEPE